MSTRFSRFPLPRLPASRAALLLALLLPVFAWAPLTYPGYLEVHSGFLPVFNLNDLARQIPDLAWAPLIGAPHDILLEERALPYLLALLLRGLGFSSVSAIKWIFGLSMLSGSLGMIAWTGRRLGAWPALIAATLYTLAPIAMATVFVRGALAETMLVGLLPWVLAATWAAVEGRPAGRVGLTLGLAAALWTQAGLALWVAAIILCALLIGWPLRQNRRRSGLALTSWAAGLLLGGLGLLPTLLQLSPGASPNGSFGEHFVYLHQLLGSWGIGPSIPGPDDTLTFNLGFVALGLTLIALVLPPSSAPSMPDDTISSRSAAKAKWFALGVVALLVFLATVLSAPVWRVAPFLSRTLTYPWQLLLLALPWVTFLAGMGAHSLLARIPPRDEASNALPIVATLLLLALLPVYGNLQPVTTTVKPGDAPLAMYGEHEIALLDITVEGMAGPGQEVSIIVHWQALRVPGQDYTVFFHVMGADGQRYGQQDTLPRGGALPTSQWRPGQVIEDRYVATLAPDAPITTLSYWLGFYKLASGERLRTATDDKYVFTVGAGR